MLFDTHVHSKFSPDGSSDMNEYITLIDEGKLDGIGFAEHLDFMPECGAYGFLDYDSYTNRIKGHKEKGYLLYAGAEIDYAHRVEEEIIDTLRKQPYDYNICSVHMIDGRSISDKNDVLKLNDEKYFEKILEGYYREIMFSLKVKEFDVIGHTGIFTRYLHPDFLAKHPLKNRIVEIFDDIAKKCAQSDKIIEVNTSGLFAAIKATIPNKSFLASYYGYGGRSLCIGSDAHNVLHAGRGFDTAISMLKDIGFKYIIIPWNKEQPKYV